MSPSSIPIRLRSFPLAMPVLMLALAIGCDSRKPPTIGDNRPANAGRDSEAMALRELDLKPDASNCRTALQLLDNTDTVLGRPVLSETDRGELAAFLKLTPAEVAEIGKQTFSQADAAYLEECLLVRTGVKSLRIDARPPLERGRFGFDWVCRLVYVDNRVPWTANPWTTLQAGSGVALSRAFAVLAAWQQLKLDGCLIGPPPLKTTPSVAATAADPATKYAPVRACGLKIGDDVFLFDHTSGNAIATADGKGVMTLAQAQAAPEAITDLAKAEEVKTWQPFLAPSLNGLSRRMDWLERFNPGNAEVRLFVDVHQQRAKYPPGASVQSWNVEGDEHSATRVLGRYANEEASSRVKAALRDTHRVQMVPLEQMPRTNLAGEALAHLNMSFGRGFEVLRYSLDSAGDSLVRGHFQETISALDTMKKAIDIARERVEHDKNLQRDFETWADRFQSLSARLILANQRGDSSAIKAAAEEFDRFRRQSHNQDIEKAFVLGHAARPLGAEVAFMMATCVHERAERSQLGNSAKAASNWQNAREWWDRYLDASAQATSPFPAREAHGRKLLARCQQFAGK